MDEHAFSYGILSDEQIATAKEIANLVEQYGQEGIAEVIRSRFKIKEIPRFDDQKTKFYQHLQKFNLAYGVQGMIREGFDTTAVNIPVVSVTGDIREFEKLVESVIDEATNS